MRSALPIQPKDTNENTSAVTKPFAALSVDTIVSQRLRLKLHDGGWTSEEEDDDDELSSLSILLSFVWRQPPI
jgi:hypothetical protein